MSVTTPDWLARHGGSVRPNVNGGWAVFFGNEPQYRVAPIPVKGKIGCRVVQTINGKLLSSENTYANEDQACQAGLEELREALGW